MSDHPNTPPHSRRHFFLRSGTPLLAWTAMGVLPACGGSSGSGEEPASTPQVSPLGDEAVLNLGATEALDAISSGRLGTERYISLLLARAEALRDLNALISLNREGALRAARALDAQRATGAKLPPLAGLPLVVKDNIDSRELPTTAGTPALRALQPSANAPSLQKLLDAGAILLGKANLHELAFGITSSNLATFAGPVRNPYDRSRIAGGSSGGTAAALAARIAPAGLGTDTGGSVRIPAALCGVAGLRPSVGNGGVQRRYHDPLAVVPISHTRDTVGPMARSVADLALLDAVITGRERPRPVGLRGLRLGVPPSFWAGLESQLASVARAARDKLAAAGVVLVEAEPLGLRELNDKVSFQIALHEPIADLAAYLAAHQRSDLSLSQLAADIASPDVRGAFSAILADAFGAAYPEAIGVHRPRLQALYASYFSDNALDAMLFPTTVLTAAVIDARNGSSTVSIDGGAPQDTFGTYIRNTDPGSNAGIPGLSLPAGLSTAGLPVGLELDGPLGSDERLLGIGLSIEQLLGSPAAPKP